MKKVFIVEAVRLPIGKFGGALKDFKAADAVAVHGALKLPFEFSSPILYYSSPDRVAYCSSSSSDRDGESMATSSTSKTRSAPPGMAEPAPIRP